eukprot:13868165-Ditylum_brightwellii.AAC.1
MAVPYLWQWQLFWLLMGHHAKETIMMKQSQSPLQNNEDNILDCEAAEACACIQSERKTKGEEEQVQGAS